MYRNIFIIILLAASFLISQNQEEIIRDFVVNGQIDASIDMNSNENSLHLVQINAVNDSLLLLVEDAIPDLDLFAGPSSYHRIITENQYERLLSTITDDYLLLINDDYQIHFIYLLDSVSEDREWDINDFELLSGWHYCKTDKDTGLPMIFTDFITGKSINKKGFRFELFDKDMNPIILECVFENTVGKAKKSGAKAMLKIYMRKDRND